jgi:hypothetical protein
MMKALMHILKTLRILAMVLIPPVLIVGCDSGGDASGGEDAPPVFSSDAFSLDIELFQGVAGKDAETGLNFINAAARVGPVSAILAINTIIPSAITAAALQVTPTFNNGVWTWSRTVLSGGQTFNFTLTAQGTSSATSWKMNVSSDEMYLGENYSDFELFSGQTQNDGTSGFWDLFYNIDGTRTEVLSGSFNNPDDDTRQVTFRIPLSAAEGGGDTVLYQVDGISRAFFWTQSRAGLLHDIRWNSFTTEGSIDADNYRQGQLSCWDKFFDDASCPAS